MNSQPYFPPPDYRPWNHDYYPQPVMDHPPPFAPASEPFPLPNPPISPPPYTDAFTELGITYVKRFILDPPVIYVASTFNGLHLWSYDPHFTQCYELAAPPGRHGKSSFCTSVEGRWPMGGYPEMPLQEQRAPRSLLNPKAIPFYYPAWRSRMSNSTALNRSHDRGEIDVQRSRPTYRTLQERRSNLPRVSSRHHPRLPSSPIIYSSISRDRTFGPGTEQPFNPRLPSSGMSSSSSDDTLISSSWSARMNHSPQSSISSSPDAWPEEMLTPTLQPVAFMVGTNPVYKNLPIPTSRHRDGGTSSDAVTLQQRPMFGRRRTN
ncbi:hypothetical protein M231_03021 [Tremella mesenterica]|uniref:Uncharacterized protein n=1 Tax=Tremella mesenterica TaxID=5217 RepID=A0A4V1M4A3_TREME|nr:hypothetical protein M231_03021 [Tremella mesenterica]